MNRRTFWVIVLSAMLAMILVSGRILAHGIIEEWVPFVPGDADLEFWMENQTSYVSVAVTFYTGGYNISNWGSINRNGCDFFVDSEIWRWTGAVILVVWTARHVYELGNLEKADYTFTFSTWSKPVKGIWFSVGLACDVNYDGKTDMKDIAIASLAFGSCSGHARWNANADVNDDGKVDMKDIGIIAKKFGTTQSAVSF